MSYNHRSDISPLLTFYQLGAFTSPIFTQWVGIAKGHEHQEVRIMETILESTHHIYLHSVD